MNIPDEILPNLWLGSFEDSQNKDFIMKNNINCIINCTLNKPFINLKIEYKYRIPIKDDKSLEEQYLLFNLLDEIINIITKHYINQDRILVHCFAGKQRSVSCIVAFIAKYTQMDLNEIIKLIQKKRPCAAKPEFNFYNSLKYYLANGSQKN